MSNPQYTPHIDWNAHEPVSLRPHPPVQPWYRNGTYWASGLFALSLHGLLFIGLISAPQKTPPKTPVLPEPIFAQLVPAPQPPPASAPKSANTSNVPPKAAKASAQNARFESTASKRPQSAKSTEPTKPSPQKVRSAPKTASTDMSLKEGISLQQALDRLADNTQVDERALAQALAFLPYPEAARLAGIEGTVVLFVTLDVQGNIAQTLISRSSGSSILDQAALQALRLLPALSGAPKEMLIPIEFSLRP